MQATSASIFDDTHRLPDGTFVKLALLGPADRADFLAGYELLSRRSRYLRFFSAMPELPEQIIDGLLDTDPENHVAIGARVVDPDAIIAPEIIGVARYSRRWASDRSAEPSVVVADDLQGHGLGRLLLRMITRYARAHGVTKFRPHTLAGARGVRTK